MRPVQLMERAFSQGPRAALQLAGSRDTSSAHRTPLLARATSTVSVTSATAAAKGAGKLRRQTTVSFGEKGVPLGEASTAHGGALPSTLAAPKTAASRLSTLNESCIFTIISIEYSFLYLSLI